MWKIPKCHSPTGLKLINLLTPGPSDKAGSSCKQSISIALFAWVLCFPLFQDSSIPFTIELERLLYFNTQTIKAFEG